jgi:hypothetical protein
MEPVTVEQLVGAVQELRVEHAATQQQLQQTRAQLQGFAGGANAAIRFTARLPKPESFSGHTKGPTVLNWTHQMENYLRACAVVLDGTSVTFAAGYLSDSALTWYRMHLHDVQTGTTAAFNSWEQFKDVKGGARQEVPAGVARTYCSRQAGSAVADQVSKSIC